jgi:hypothetical protein
MMTKTFLALGAAAVALSAMPADAQYRHHGRACVKMRHGHCVRYRGAARFRTGYVFGPRYTYTSYRALPPVYVRRYDLNPRYRYVYRDNYIYVVNPRTYAIERIIDAFTR